MTDPMKILNYDPITGKTSPLGADDAPPLTGKPCGCRGPCGCANGEAPASDPNEDTSCAWDNLSGQERGIWSSVFGMAYVHACNTQAWQVGQAPYLHAKTRANRAVLDHRQFGR